MGALGYSRQLNISHLNNNGHTTSGGVSIGACAADMTSERAPVARTGQLVIEIPVGGRS
jgi:hypothetical protein